jgi:hypothetical protein
MALIEIGNDGSLVTKGKAFEAFLDATYGETYIPF